jgi:hypothetical protein
LNDRAEEAGAAQHRDQCAVTHSITNVRYAREKAPPKFGEARLAMGNYVYLVAHGARQK